jgi:uroporphyrin-III C-methyltransferase/precorrin-2 dehydrogenase/sirohydrochlorin ferrochelatase/uroporphyrin-III C-methyltransferase
MQNVYNCNIHDYAKKYGGNSYVSPTLIIIGKVAALHEQFQWISNSNSKEYYFKPVEKNAKKEARA